MNAGAKPSRLFLGNSIIIISLCIFFTSVALASFDTFWDPVSGLMILPFPVAIGICQYRSTFRRNPGAAKVVAILLFLIGGLIMASFISAVIPAVRVFIEAGRIDFQFTVFCGTLFVVSIYCGFSGWINLRWARRIRRQRAYSGAESGGGEPREPALQGFQFSMRELMIFVTVVTVITGLTTWMVRDMKPQYGLNVTPDQVPFSLPDGATDVSYCQGIRGMLAYEFTISEEGFLAWANSGLGSLEALPANVPLKRINGVHEIHRCYSLISGLSGQEFATIRRGYYYSWLKEDRGVYYAYDLDTGRAYYFAHSH